MLSIHGAGEKRLEDSRLNAHGTGYVEVLRRVIRLTILVSN